MDNIIVTVIDSANLFSMDVELPVDIRADRLIREIIGLMNSKEEYRKYVDENYKVFCEKLNCVLDDDDTPASVGIHNGDLLVLI